MKLWIILLKYLSVHSVLPQILLFTSFFSAPPDLMAIPRVLPAVFLLEPSRGSEGEDDLGGNHPRYE
jgi:hypothetical protein